MNAFEKEVNRRYYAEVSKMTQAEVNDKKKLIELRAHIEQQYREEIERELAHERERRRAAT